MLIEGIKMNEKKFKKYIYGALFAALTFVATFVVKIPIPASGGYIHPGDGIYLAAAILLGPLAGGFAGAIGSAAADIVGGYIPFVIPTFIIKGVSGFIVGKIYGDKSAKSSKKALAFILYALIICGGYFIADYIITSSVAACVPELFFNMIQSAAGIVFALLISRVLKKVDIKG